MHSHFGPHEMNPVVLGRVVEVEVEPCPRPHLRPVAGERGLREPFAFLDRKIKPASLRRRFAIRGLIAWFRVGATVIVPEAVQVLAVKDE